MRPRIEAVRIPGTKRFTVYDAATGEVLVERSRHPMVDAAGILLRMGCDPSLELEYYRSDLVADGKPVFVLAGRLDVWGAPESPGPHPSTIGEAFAVAAPHRPKPGEVEDSLGHYLGLG